MYLLNYKSLMFLKVTLTWPLLLADFEYDISTLTIDSSIHDDTLTIDSSMKHFVSNVILFFKFWLRNLSSVHLWRFLTFSGYFMKNSKQSLTDSNIGMLFFIGSIVNIYLELLTHLTPLKNFFH